MTELIEIEPGRWVVKRPPRRPSRSDLPMPYVISDIMPATEHVDGKFYTSKRQFRAVTKAHGLTEIGTEKQPPKVRASIDKAEKTKRRNQIKTAMDKHAAGLRPGGRRV